MSERVATNLLAVMHMPFMYGGFDNLQNSWSGQLTAQKMHADHPNGQTPLLSGTKNAAL